MEQVRKNVVSDDRPETVRHPDDAIEDHRLTISLHLLFIRDLLEIPIQTDQPQEGGANSLVYPLHNGSFHHALRRNVQAHVAQNPGDHPWSEQEENEEPERQDDLQWDVQQPRDQVNLADDPWMDQFYLLFQEEPDCPNR